MKKMRKTAAMLAAIVATSMVSSNILVPYAAESKSADSSINNENSKETVISVKKTWGMPGKQAKVVLSMANNPGIVGLTLQIVYDDSAMKLVKAENGTAVSGDNITFTPPSSGNNYIWAGTSVKADEISDGTLLTLTFDINGTAKLGEYPVKVSCTDAVGNELKQIPVTINNAAISIIDYVPGDANGDGNIAMNDLILMTRHIADGGYNENGYAAKVNKAACDINSDSKISVLDVVLLARYIADGGCNPNGYNVTPLPAPFQCSHSSLNHVDAVEAASCKENGNIEYWHCEDCDKYYSDELCNNEINKSDIVTKGEHTVVIDPAVAATTDKTGLTEGSHCSVCGEVLTKQEVVPALKESGDYSITYNVVGSDTYLATLNIENPNPKFYSAGDTIKLQDLEVPGYVFEGWYDGQGKNANQITSVSADTSGNLKLYAHWSVIEYHINFDTDKTLNNPDLPSITYTIDRGATLPNMSLTGYYFIGWADANNNIVSSVPKGSYGNMTLYPIWSSHRNSTHPNDYEKEGAASITEWDDEEGNTNISFLYNIGTIENVPICQIGKWMNNAGIKEEVEDSVSYSTSKNCAESFVKAVSDATTNSSSWTLSKEWNETIDTESVLSQAISSEQRTAAESFFENNNEWSIGAGYSKDKTVTNSDGKSDKISIGAKIGGEISRAIGATIKLDGVEIGVKQANKLIGELTGGYEHEKTNTKTTSNKSSWNLEGSYSNSKKAGGNLAFSNAISSSLAKSEKYGHIVTNKEGMIKTNEIEQYSSSSNSYSNTFAYSTAKEQGTVHKYSNSDAPAGYYRKVVVGTAYVFAVVNYNIATHEFYVNTYSVIDDDSCNTYWDYSASTSEFNDHQNGILPFAVPFEVNEYIGELTTKTEGITVDKETGIVNGYTGTDIGVYIPEYVSYDNNDQTHTSKKVTGISSTAFAGNKDITAIILPDSVTEIPAGAFKNCTSLKTVIGKNITSIGANAFQNCSSLENFTVESSVIKLGSKAFDNAGSVTINAANADIVSAVNECGANSIVLNLKDCNDSLENIALNISNDTEYFKLEGAGKTLSNVEIISDAKTTEIQNIVMNNSVSRPIVTSSDSLIIGSSTITAPSIAVVLLADTANITAYGQSSIVSKSEYAVLSYNELYNGIDGTDIAKVNITGNIAACGDIEGENFINFTTGKVVKIDEDEFESLLNNVTTFDLNKSEITLNTDGASKNYQLTLTDLPSDINASDISWMSSDPSIATVSDSGLVTGINDGSAEITATLNGASVSCNVSVKTEYTEAWSDWSDWSTTKVDASDTVQVQKEDRGKDVVVSYNMDAYCTVANDPWRRQYRNFSVNGKYSSYGLSTTYGEFHHKGTWSVADVKAAKVIHPGEQQGGDQTGTNMANVDGYSLSDGSHYYIYFITSENYNTVYTTYYKSRHLVKTPVEYQN